MAGLRGIASVAAVMLALEGHAADSVNPSPMEPPRCVVAPPPGGYITAPKWAAHPNGDDIARFYPERSDPLPGCAILDCRVASNLGLEDCQVLVALPPDEDYGAASLKLSHYFKIDPARSGGGGAIGRRVRIAIRWQLAPPEAAKTP